MAYAADNSRLALPVAVSSAQPVSRVGRIALSYSYSSIAFHPCFICVNPWPRRFQRRGHGDGHTQDRRILLDQHGDAAAGGGATFFGQDTRLVVLRDAGIGHGVRVGGRDVGGLFDLDGPNTPPGLKPHIGVMVKVDNADAVCDKVRPSAAPPDRHSTSWSRDAWPSASIPNGAEFDVWEPKKMLGTDVDSALHGAPCWFETLTTDVDRATEFYAGLFGWTPEVMPMSGYDYTTFKLDDAYEAGLMQITPEMGTIQPHWGTYFTVKDVDETCAGGGRSSAPGSACRREISRASAASAASRHRKASRSTASSIRSRTDENVRV